MSIVLAEAFTNDGRGVKERRVQIISYERRKPGDLTEGVIHRRMRSV
jgi:hypothetical protein